MDENIKVHIDEATLRRKMMQGMINVVEEIEAVAIDKTPMVTGNLVSTIYSEVDRAKSIGIVGAASEYAVYVHEGTGIQGPNGRPFEIRPRVKKGLMWDGAIHPMKKVIHPGQKPQPFLLDAYNEVQPRIAELFAEGFEK